MGPQTHLLTGLSIRGLGFVGTSVREPWRVCIGGPERALCRKGLQHRPPRTADPLPLRGLVLKFRSHPVLRFLGGWGVGTREGLWFQEQLKVTVLSSVCASAACVWFGSFVSGKQLKCLVKRCGTMLSWFCGCRFPILFIPQSSERQADGSTFH